MERLDQVATIVYVWIGLSDGKLKQPFMPSNFLGKQLAFLANHNYLQVQVSPLSLTKHTCCMLRFLVKTSTRSCLMRQLFKGIADHCAPILLRRIVKPRNSEGTYKKPCRWENIKLAVRLG
ncbi:hypothetical protein DSO57_1016003 [Entomophthora muscae]|uniref:Uncharacterized protein n=1 Tax=Entomophthora muscae TaxID=34485 RepID=A0ACC2STX3_9FUNG|nr:hypothetical protein DSO57_1016003 [Entomophthora muscae]